MASRTDHPLQQPSGGTTPRWYALTTQPRHEKVVADQLLAKSLESFLPLTTMPSRWKDRSVLIDRPLFPGYVFTRIDLRDRQHVFSIPGVVRMLTFNGSAAAIDDAEIEAVRLCLAHGDKPEPHPLLNAGERVRVISGTLAGLEGVVVRSRSQCRIVIAVTMIHQAMAVEVDARLLEPASASPGSGQNFHQIPASPASI